jgi:hypothetical protein
MHWKTFMMVVRISKHGVIGWTMIQGLWLGHGYTIILLKHEATPRVNEARILEFIGDLTAQSKAERFLECSSVLSDTREGKSTALVGAEYVTALRNPTSRSRVT